MEKQKSVFETLKSLDITQFIEMKPTGKTKKNPKTGKWEEEFLRYLSWMNAWCIVKNLYSTASYKIYHTDGKPYIYDKALGYMVWTAVTIENETLECWLAVTDGKNDALKDEPYIYQAKKYRYEEGKRIEDGLKDIHVAAANMFDINTAIMRCLVKNFAMHGLGTALYVKEDLELPSSSIHADTPKHATPIAKPQAAKAAADAAIVNSPERTELIRQLTNGFQMIEQKAFKLDQKQASVIKYSIELKGDDGFKNWKDQALKNALAWVKKVGISEAESALQSDEMDIFDKEIAKGQ